MQDMKSPFEEEGGFPGVIGVVDGTDVGPLNTNQRPTSTEVPLNKFSGIKKKTNN